MKPIRSLEVLPNLPPELECIRELAYNLRFSWDHETVNLFRRLDKDLWESSGHNPVLLLGLISQEKLNEAAKDEGFRIHLDRLCDRFRQYMRSDSSWYSHQNRPRQGVVAYFSAEFGLSEALPIYSGGLGVLAGDHVKSASELGIPLVGVGIVYQEGYFRQYLNADGWQQERYPLNDFYNLPLVPCKEKDGSPVTISVDFPGRKVYARIWKVQVGRVPLYLLDTNIPQNSPKDQEITDALYHGDSELRIQQEMILGLGGMRALEALGIEPAVCHMNEGHSAFLGLERIRMFMNKYKLNFRQAREVAAAGQVFTTHTAVPAGIDKFTPELVDRYFLDYGHSLGLSREQFLALGRTNNGGSTSGSDALEPFSMATLAINMSSKINAVSKLHGVVSRKLFGDQWKGVPEDEVPITHITNGVHPRTWVSEEISELFERYLGPNWSEEIDPNIWKRVEEIPDEELWRIHERRRQRLVTFARGRLRKQMQAKGALPSELKEFSEVLDPEALTIGFARRMATYKRSTLLLSDPERLASILNNKERPVQIIIAGKAHPEDKPAKGLIRELIHFSRRADVKSRFVFIEDYDMNVARWMVQGVDVWLNTPRRFLEASGTSGMKVAFNGGINVSILDGWWDEAYQPQLGWAIGSGEVYDDNDYQDKVESQALYDLLEKEIVPTYYDRDRDGRPRNWVARMKAELIALCPQFSINRMVREYATKVYFPLFTRQKLFVEKDAQVAKDMAAWKQELQRAWAGVSIDSVEAGSPEQLQVGDELKVTALVQLNALKTDDVSVQIYHGPIDSYGDIIEGEIVPMKFTGYGKGTLTPYEGTIKYYKSGRHGFTVRVLPHHENLSSPFETGLVHWAAEPVNVSV